MKVIALPNVTCGFHADDAVIMMRMPGQSSNDGGSSFCFCRTLPEPHAAGESFVILALPNDAHFPRREAEGARCEIGNLTLAEDVRRAMKGATSVYTTWRLSVLPSRRRATFCRT